jgi:hypothetical protein
MKGLADVRRALPARAGDDLRALLGQHARGLEADSGGRAGDDADTVFQAEIHDCGLR